MHFHTFIIDELSIILPLMKVNFFWMVHIIWKKHLALREDFGFLTI